MASVSRHEELSPTKRALIEIRELRARLAQAESGRRDPIAIVGAGLRFPGGAVDLASYWEILAGGVDTIGPIPPDRWDIDAYYDPDPDTPGRMYSRLGGFLGNIDQFDPYFFDISPREAERMDPQQRLLLETTWEALEQAGISADSLDGSLTGVFLGMANSDYFRLLASDANSADLYMTTGSAFSIAAGRISYLLGLRGPSMAIDSACSSSLVAVHLAVQSLRNCESDLALAGGVNLILSPEANISFSQARMMAPDGRCKTFDAAADGYVRSEGCGLVVLKRLSDALEDGDPILAVIRGSAVNQDGRSNGLTAPNGPSQEAVIQAALLDAQVTSSQVHYVEAHGTGTSLGDPIEVQALGAVLSDRGDSGPLLIGSAKTNLGHLEAAAGMAGLLKVVLMLQHGQIAPSLHLANPTPHIPWQRLPLEVVTRLREWPQLEGGRIAGVSSFGFSGTNAHIILEAHPAPEPIESPVPRTLELLPLSAHTPAALAALAGRYAGHIEMHPERGLADVVATLGSGRAHHLERLALSAPDTRTAKKLLAEIAAGGEPGGLRRGRAASEAPEVVFLFTGQGAQYAGMGKELYDQEPVFRAALDRCAALLEDQLERPLLEVMFAEAGSSEAALLDETIYTQPALFALEHALSELWQSWGVWPVAVAGHSLGEYVAACVAGVLSLEDGLKLVAARGRLMGSLPPGGTMAAVLASESTIIEVLGDNLLTNLSFAAINGPTSAVLSGDASSIEVAVGQLRSAGIEARELAISLAAHSPLVEPILDAFEAEAAATTRSLPQLALISCMTGSFVTNEVLSSGYWRQHLREPVRFGTALETLCGLGRMAFIEVGPHPVLLGMARHAVDPEAGIWLPSMRRGRGDWEQLLESLGDFYVAGGAPDWSRVAAPGARRQPGLPTYPFQRQRYWAAPQFGAGNFDRKDQWEAVSNAALRQSEQGPLDLDAARYPARWQALDRLATAHIVRALRALELFTEAGERHRVAGVIESRDIQPAYRNVLGRWFSNLAEEGLLVRDVDEFIAVSKLPEPDIDSAEAAAARELSEIEPLLDYALRSGRQLELILTGKIGPLDLLFPGGSYVTSDFMYQEWAVARYLNGIVRASVAAISDALLDRPLRLIEIGAGTGGTTAQILPALSPDRTTYVFTDVSDFFLVRARERFASHPFLDYRILDIECSPDSQGFAAGSYDIVVASNVLHATRDLDATLSHVRELLAPGGVLILLEATHHPHWFDITIGLVEGWQAFDDDWRENNPLISEHRWQDALRTAGFDAVLALPTNGTLADSFGQHVMIARKPGELRTAGDSWLEGSSVIGGAFSANGAVAGQLETPLVLDELTDALPNERGEILRKLVSGLVARVLRADADQAFPYDERLQDLGLDSLMAVELRDQIGRSLALPAQLPATLIFDYPSIASIAAYLEQDVLWPADGKERPPALSNAVAGPLGMDSIAELSDEEIEQILVKKLERY